MGVGVEGVRRRVAAGGVGELDVDGGRVAAGGVEPAAQVVERAAPACRARRARPCGRSWPATAGAGNGHQPSPRSATRWRARPLLPPIQIGGCGCADRTRVGGDAAGAEVPALERDVVARPDRAGSRRWPRRRGRCARRGRRRGRRTRSSGSPRPTARVKRPPESRSRVAPALATTNGFRYGSTTMLGISRIVVVPAAAQPIATNGSRASWPPPSSQRCDGAGWSVNPKPPNPAASAAPATVAMPAPETRSGWYGCVIIGWVMANCISGPPARPRGRHRRTPGGVPRRRRS